MTKVISHLNEQGILNLSLSNPQKLNILSTECLKDLSHIFDEVKDNDAVRALIITGEGKAFSAGADIERLAACDAHSGYAFAKEGQAIFRKLETIGKPSLAAVNGYAFGGGCELAISTSIRIASKNALFGQPEVKLGVIPGYGGTQRLARLIGKGRAMDLCLTGRNINAEQALAWGLVTEVTEPEHLLNRANEILHGILSMGPIAIEAVMEAINYGYDLPLQEALHLEAIHFSRTCASEDKKEGVTAFLEKRHANFKGK